jgi:hypothetical protein
MKCPKCGHCESKDMDLKKELNMDLKKELDSEFEVDEDFDRKAKMGSLDDLLSMLEDQDAEDIKTKKVVVIKKG